jgi:hypothetical protein
LFSVITPLPAVGDRLALSVRWLVCSVFTHMFPFLSSVDEFQSVQLGTLSGLPSLFSVVGIFLTYSPFLYRLDYPSPCTLLE